MVVSSIFELFNSAEIISLLNSIDSLVWGPPLLILLVGTGAYLTIRLKFLQVSKLPLALKDVARSRKVDKRAQGDVSSFAALCTALSATIGTGNIVGVATAIAKGGPGALFWMWLAAFFGMATKYAEALLAVKYRTVDENGQMSGGPMYYIKNGLGHKSYSGILAKLFAFFGICAASLGVGTFTQVNAIVKSVEMTFGVPGVDTAVVVALLVALVTIGGIKSISRVAQLLVPFMAIAYVLGCLVVIAFNIENLPAALALVVKSAFTPTAASGGFLGAGVMLAIQMGVARGIFSNESGLGSAPIAAAAAKVREPAKQGLISMTGTFFDTIVICSMTGLTLILSGAWTSGASEAAYMTNNAFSAVLPTAGTYIVTIGLIFFAFTTILGWNYYGERCTEYLVGVKGILPYKAVYVFLVAAGGFLSIEAVWIIADIFNGLMAFPNLIALLALSGVVVKETEKYLKSLEAKPAGIGAHAGAHAPEAVAAAEEEE
ncbi:sodium:alanine symporter family protein [Methanosarcina sp. KYL-1]|uniref:alanine/glycine:cation symporter family protein n=1 Tax=Methanosarcina sp. KYL-1 TaxID=2602068 RepID=UPI0021009F88|nr:sodium:alanine symporter family protein [Methanosarcina sp. KYL-1]MCQ1534855.1 sodium:alanine symporter family protein [Methanosarcina sp. KYL-1]